MSATLGPFFSSEPMARIFSDQGRVQAMLDFEAALAQAQAVHGMIPAEAADAIEVAARAEDFDFAVLGREVLKGGNLAIPLVKALTARVASQNAEAARFVHWGATSQDVIDTGLILQMRQALALIEADLLALGDRLAMLAEEHAKTPIIARTLIQQAVPTTLGLKLAGWLAALKRARQLLAANRPRWLALQFGGAAGNLAAYGSSGLTLAKALAERLQLSLPDLPWHGQRDRIVEIGAALGILLGGFGKMGGDLALMAQSEIGEFREPSGGGRGGSSAMPHKANPVSCVRMIAAAKQGPGLVSTLLASMDQEHERGLGGWHAEWETLPELFRLTSAALEAARLAVEQGSFDTGRMRANLELTNGLVMAEAVSIALAEKLGKTAGHELTARAAQKAVAEKQPLRDCLEADADIAKHFSAADLDALFAPEDHLGAAPDFVQRAVTAWRS